MPARPAFMAGKHATAGATHLRATTSSPRVGRRQQVTQGDLGMLCPASAGSTTGAPRRARRGDEGSVRRAACAQRQKRAPDPDSRRYSETVS